MKSLRGLLEVGRVAELRNGEIGIILENKIMTQTGWVNLSNDWYSSDLKSRRGVERRGWDVVKIYDCPTINDSTWNLANDDRSLLKLVWERKDFEVSEDEKAILKSLPSWCKYIIRDSVGNLRVFQDAPYRANNRWYVYPDSTGAESSLHLFNNLFQYIKNEDSELAIIADLLNS